MDDWRAVEHVGELLAGFPGRLAPFRRARSESSATKADIETGLDIVRSGLLALGPQTEGELIVERSPSLPEHKHLVIETAGSLRALSAGWFKGFCEANRAEFEAAYYSSGATMSDLSRSLLRSFLSKAATDVLRDVPYHGQPDPDGLRGLAVAWLNDNARLMADGFQAGCLRLMVSRGSDGVVPVAKRLYREAAVGSWVRRAVEEIFVDEVLSEIQAAASLQADP